MKRRVPKGFKKDPNFGFTNGQFILDPPTRGSSLWILELPESTMPESWEDESLVEVCRRVRQDLLFEQARLQAQLDALDRLEYDAIDFLKDDDADDE